MVGRASRARITSEIAGSSSDRFLTLASLKSGLREPSGPAILDWYGDVCCYASSADRSGGFAPEFALPCRSGRQSPLPVALPAPRSPSRTPCALLRLIPIGRHLPEM